MRVLKVDGMDLIDGQDVRDGIKGKYDTIVHLAGYMKDEEDLYENNVDSTLKVIDYCKEHNAHLIFTSSAAVYGDPAFCPSREDDVLNPINVYGKSKVICEELIQSRLSANQFIILRLSNVSEKPGSVYDQLNEKVPVIYGDGTQIRDFIDIDDVVKVIKECAKLKRTGIYNISSGRGVSINEFFKIMGLKPKHIKKRKEIYTSILDNTKWRERE
jgi:UDP-glucose 4-epimerase